MAACVSPIRPRSVRTMRSSSSILVIFLHFYATFFSRAQRKRERERVRVSTHRYALSYPREFRERFFLSLSRIPRSAFYVPARLSGDISQNLRQFSQYDVALRAHRFIAERLPDVAAHSSRKIARRRIQRRRTVFATRELSEFRGCSRDVGLDGGVRMQDAKPHTGCRESVGLSAIDSKT